jgi:hypothetical protein
MGATKGDNAEEMETFCGCCKRRKEGTTPSPKKLTAKAAKAAGTGQKTAKRADAPGAAPAPATATEPKDPKLEEKQPLLEDDAAAAVI